MPALLRFVPNAGRLRDVKHYLYLFCYFLQPTPGNIRSMLLYALKHYSACERLSKVEIPPPETMPAVGIYHPDAPALFQTFESYRKWYERRGRGPQPATLDATQTVGFLLMRTHIVSGTRRHYDGLIRAIELEGLSVLPVISTFMDNREACARFFAEDGNSDGDTRRAVEAAKTKSESVCVQTKARVSQIVSLTGFSFVGGPAMNDSEAAVEFLRGLNRPFRSAVSLDLQTIESWRESQTGLNPVQSGMQIAIPEIDAATEPFVPADCPREALSQSRSKSVARASHGVCAAGTICEPPNARPSSSRSSSSASRRTRGTSEPPPSLTFSRASLKSSGD